MNRFIVFLSILLSGSGFAGSSAVPDSIRVEYASEACLKPSLHSLMENLPLLFISLT